MKYVDDEGQTREFDALLLCDRLGAGQQLAAQAGNYFNRIGIWLFDTDFAGYPIICIPIGVDSTGLPISLSLQHTAGKESTLIRWASAIEDLLHSNNGGRAVPTYRNHLSKDIPVKE